jgi:hypothetical protein
MTLAALGAVGMVRPTWRRLPLLAGSQKLYIGADVAGPRLVWETAEAF